MGEVVRACDVIPTKDDCLEFWRKELRVEETLIDSIQEETGERT